MEAAVTLKKQKQTPQKDKDSAPLGGIAARVYTAVLSKQKNQYKFPLVVTKK